ncbi:MAG: glycine cleavage system aminomethyltransferase GcvT [Halanaerobiales bacterium]
MKTPLYEVHRELGARMVDFAGWEMPVQYSGIIDEHLAVRNRAGLFDVSHMGEFLFTGNDALSNLERLVTNNVSRLDEGHVIYTPMCDHNGGIIDDLLIYCISKEEYMMVVNASNIAKDFRWITENISGSVKVANASDKYSLLALQGPDSIKILSKITDEVLENIEYYSFKKGTLSGIDVIISRTGYTGELGFELYCNPIYVKELWKIIMEAGKRYELLPVGLGARDTLRLEKKFCLYGNEIDLSRHPLEAGLSWTVKFSKEEFIGKKALLEYKENGYKQKLIGFKLTGRGIPRHGYQVAVSQAESSNAASGHVGKENSVTVIGEVTSGSYSPTLEENIGLAYVDKDYARVGQEIKVIIRKRPVDAVIVETPFV